MARVQAKQLMGSFIFMGQAYLSASHKIPHTISTGILKELTMMTCKELADRIEAMQPNASPQDVARLCLLLTNTVDDLQSLDDVSVLRNAWKQTGLKLQVATDQHAAMTQELEDLASSDPESFTQDQIWILIRAIKVQSQILQMYVGHPWLEV